MRFADFNRGETSIFYLNNAGEITRYILCKALECKNETRLRGIFGRNSANSEIHPLFR